MLTSLHTLSGTDGDGGKRRLVVRLQPDLLRVGDSVEGRDRPFKTEVIRLNGPWRHLEAVEFATLDLGRLV